jgi:hypothetical protein
MGFIFKIADGKGDTTGPKAPICTKRSHCLIMSKPQRSIPGLGFSICDIGTTNIQEDHLGRISIPLEDLPK